MPSHAKFAPSGMKRKRLCPGSHQAEAAYPPKPSGLAAIEGTHVHTLIEDVIGRNADNANGLEGQEMVDHEGTFTVTLDMVHAANMTLQYFDQVLESLPEEVEYGCEIKVDPGAVIERNDWHGTLDLGIWWIPENDTQPAFIEVIDHKNGSFPVSPENNDQLISYAIGLIDHIPPVAASSTVRLTISQPKSGGIKSWTTTVEELLTEALPMLETVIEACLAEDPVFNPGDEQCQFCAHKRGCPYRQSMALEAANQALSGIEVAHQEPQVIPAGNILPTELPAIDSIDAPTRAQLLLAAPMLRGWLKDLEEDSIDRVQKGMHIPGFKLINKKGRRAWIDDPELVIKRLCNLSVGGQRLFKKADVTREVPVSFTTILGDSRLNERQKAQIEQKLIRQGKGGVSLVPESAKGEDVSPSSKLADVNVSLQLPEGENNVSHT